MPDPRFPRRPNHPDFWLLSEVLVAQDAAAERPNEPFEDMVNRYVDLESLSYAADGQAGMMLDQIAKNEHVLGRMKVRTMLSAAFLGAFVHGIHFQIRKQVDQQAGELPWVVHRYRAGALPGEMGDPIARFSSESDAGTFIVAVLRERDPDGVDRGDYGVRDTTPATIGT